MIFSRWGNSLTIIAYCGKHKPKWAAGPLVLVKARFDDDGRERFMHTHSMKADGGWQEIDAAVDAAPEVTLTAAELKRALREAE